MSMFWGQSAFRQRNTAACHWAAQTHERSTAPQCVAASGGALSLEPAELPPSFLNMSRSSLQRRVPSRPAGRRSFTCTMAATLLPTQGVHIWWGTSLR